MRTPVNETPQQPLRVDCRRPAIGPPRLLLAATLALAACGNVVVLLEGTEPSDCSDGADNDADGLFDCADDGCFGAPACTSPDRHCDGALVDTDTDPLHCGGCGISCAAGQGCVDGSCCGLATEKADVLFVIDNSRSMAEEQAALVSQMPYLLSVLTTGDFEGDGRIDFPPVTDLHLGVVSTDMGTGGFPVPTCSDRNFGDDGLLQQEGSGVAGCASTYPPFLSFGGDLDALASDFACVVNLGTDGCGFEQQLEALLKALTASSSPVRFSSGTVGHGDGANAGFLRPDSVLMIILLTDEEDCSAADPELFNLSTFRYPGDINLRCYDYPEALHRTDRYVQGLLALRPDASRLVYTMVAGIPADLLDEGLVDWDRVLSDERMSYRTDPLMPTQLLPACEVPGRTIAFPPRRMVEVGRDLEARGATASVGSICDADLTSVFQGLLRTLSRELIYECR